jgi:hypothetical protein
LNHCIIDFPRRDEARFPLFQAAVMAHKDEMALAIVQPVFRQFTGGYVAPSEEDQIISSDSRSDDNGEQGASPTSVASKLTRSQQVLVAQTLGEILLRLKRPSEALPYFRTARRLETAAANRRLLERRIVDLGTLLRMQQQNAARQPVLHEALEQDRIVRPRLLARAAPASSLPSTSKGGVKQ